eukprot:scaffold43650_cov48-Phaeocystis_antarctica.AAC.7
MLNKDLNHCLPATQSPAGSPVPVPRPQVIGTDCRSPRSGSASACGVSGGGRAAQSWLSPPLAPPSPPPAQPRAPAAAGWTQRPAPPPPPRVRAPRPVRRPGRPAAATPLPGRPPLRPPPCRPATVPAHRTHRKR